MTTTSMAKYIRPGDLKSHYGIDRVTAWRWSRDDEIGFPRPIRLSANVSVYDTSEIDAWFAERKNKGETH